MGFCSVVLRRPSDINIESFCSMERPVGVAQKFTANNYYICLAATEICSACTASVINPTAGGNTRAGTIDQINTNLFEQRKILLTGADPNHRHPIRTGDAYQEGSSAGRVSRKI